MTTELTIDLNIKMLKYYFATYPMIDSELLNQRYGNEYKKLDSNSFTSAYLREEELQTHLSLLRLALSQVRKLIKQ